MDFAAKAAVARVVGITTRLRIEAAKLTRGKSSATQRHVSAALVNNVAVSCDTFSQYERRCSFSFCHRRNVK